MTEGDHLGEASLDGRLTLADWRRRVAELYAEVRRLAADDPPAAHAHWRRVRDRLYREHPQSPVPPDQRGALAPAYWPYDPALRFELRASPAAASAAAPAPFGDGAGLLALPNSGTDTLAFERFGRVEVPFPDGRQSLSVFWMQGYAGGLFLPFRDATNGSETYGAGRYLLDGAKSADLGGDPDRGTLVLDFNFAYQPSCAFDPKWACPLAPPENRLTIAVRAGERLA